MAWSLTTSSRLFWATLRFSKRVWVRMTLIAVLAIIAAGSARLLQWLIPAPLADRFGDDAVRPILNVLSASMLAVTTFSLNVMVSAHRAASSQATPRSHRLLLSDTTTQTVLATFLGAFIYALTSIVLINAGLYTPRSVVVNFVFTVFVIVLVVIAILRWIEHLSRLGSVLETCRKVEDAAAAALGARRRTPFLNGRPDHEAPVGLGHRVWPDRVGYITFVDTRALARLARENGCSIRLLALPGTFVAPGRALAVLDRPGLGDAVRDAFAIEDARTFEQDPRFGLIVLSEIALRALSPGINDPGTAIDIVGRLLRLLSAWEMPVPRVLADPDPARGWLYVPALQPADLIEDAFAAIARDGAGQIEVALQLQKALALLADHRDPALATAARRLSARAFELARERLPHPDDVARLGAVLPGAVRP